MPYAHGMALSQYAGDRLFSFVSVENAGHNDIESRHWNVLKGTLASFLEFLEKEEEEGEEEGKGEKEKEKEKEVEME